MNVKVCKHPYSSEQNVMEGHSKGWFEQLARNANLKGQKGKSEGPIESPDQKANLSV